MAKTYILEPTEILFTYLEEALQGNLASDITESLENSTLEVEEYVFKVMYAGVSSLDNSVFFTEDGTMPEEAPSVYAIFIGEHMILTSPSLPTENCTLTVSIYTESEDPEPEPTPSVGLTPITREEHYLSAIAGLTELPSGMKPVTRKEMFLDAILNGGGSVTPVTREEMYLDAIANKE